MPIFYYGTAELLIMLLQYGLCFSLNEVWNPEHRQQPGHPAEKCRSNNNCPWFFWTRSIMSDSSGAFSRQWQSRVGSLWPLCTTSIWWIKAWANGSGAEGRGTVRPGPDKRESVCADLLSQQEVFDISQHLCRTVFSVFMDWSCP